MCPCLSVQVEEREVVGLMEQLLRSPRTSPVTKDYIINALMKLTARLSPAVRCAVQTLPLAAPHITHEQFRILHTLPPLSSPPLPSSVPNS